MREELTTRNLPVWRGGKIVAYALVDDYDLPTVGRHRWGLMGTDPRVARTERRRAIYLARILVGLDYGDPRQADHINRDPLDNRRANLRILTSGQQQQNRGSGANSTSRYRGVAWDKTHGRWQAYSRLDGKMKHLGRFDDEKEAARVAAEFRAIHMPFSNEVGS